MRLFLVITMAAVLANAVGRADQAEKELKRFQGAWQAAFMQNPDGQLASAATLQATTLVITGNKLTLRSDQLSISGTFTLGPNSTPNHIDVTLDQPDPSKPAVRLLGVYAWKDGRRLSAFALPEKARPSLVVREPGYLVLEWEKSKK